MQKVRLLLLSVFFVVPAFGEDLKCEAEVKRAKRAEAAFGEMLGIVEGTIYGHSLTLNSSTVCLGGTPKEKVQAIAKAFMSDSFAEAPILMDDVPSREQAIEFLERFFPCK